MKSLLACSTLTCLAGYHVFICWYRQSWRKWRSRSISLNYIRSSVTCWLRGFWAWTISVLRSPNTMVYWSRKRVRAYYKSSKCSKVEGGRYAPMIGVHFLLVMTSQITTFGPWKRIDSTLQTWVRYQTTRHTPPCAPPASIMLINKHTTSHPILL